MRKGWSDLIFVWWWNLFYHLISLSLNLIFRLASFVWNEILSISFHFELWQYCTGTNLDFRICFLAHLGTPVSEVHDAISPLIPNFNASDGCFFRTHRERIPVPPHVTVGQRPVVVPIALHLSVDDPITPLVTSLHCVEAVVVQIFACFQDICSSTSVAGQMSYWSITTVHVQINQTVAVLLPPLQSHDYMFRRTQGPEILL